MKLVSSRKLRILIVDDDRRMLHTLMDILQFKGYEVHATNSGESALKKLRETSFDCLLSDIRMPGMDGLTLYQRAQELQPNLPVIFVTAYATDEIIQQGLRAGALGVLNKPLDINHLLAFFATLQQDQTIAIVDDDPTFCSALSELLQKRGFFTRVITDPHHVMEHIDEQTDIVLLDLKLNDISGLDVLKMIRAHFAHLPVILITGYSDEMMPLIRAAREMNIFTYMTKPLNWNLLDQTLAEVRKRELQKGLRGEAG